MTYNINNINKMKNTNYNNTNNIIIFILYYSWINNIMNNIYSFYKSKLKIFMLYRIIIKLLYSINKFSIKVYFILKIKKMSHRGFEPRFPPLEQGALTPWTNETSNFLNNYYFILLMNIWILLNNKFFIQNIK